MSIFKKITFVFTVFLLSFSVHASSPSVLLMNLLEKVHTLKADFSQTMQSQQGKIIEASKGHVWLSRPGKFRWEVTKPTPQLIVTNGKKLWIYDPDLQQVNIRSLKKEVGEAPALLLSDSRQAVEKKFAVQLMKNKQTSMLWFSLKPKNPDSVFLQIQIGFLSGYLHEMKLIDHMGHVTRIQFSALKTGISLSSSLFTFVPPKGVDVIS